MGHFYTLVFHIFSNSVLDFLLCLGSLSCFSCPCHTGGLISLECKIDSVNSRCPGPLVANQRQIITVPLPMHTSHVCSHQSLFQKSYGLFRCDVANLSHCAMFLFKEKRRRGFFVATFQNKPYPFRLLLIEMSQTFSMLTEACREGDVALGFSRSFSEHCTV